MGLSSRGNHDTAARKRARRAGANAGGTAVLNDVLGDVMAQASKFRDVIPALGQVWAQRQNTIFETGSYGRWRALKADTILQKRAEGLPMTILVDSRTLRGQVTNPTPRAEGSGFVVFGPSDWGSIDYAKHHMLGNNGMPQRNPVPRLTNRERETFMELLRDHFRPEGMKKAVSKSGAPWKFAV